MIKLGQCKFTYTELIYFPTENEGNKGKQNRIK